LVSKLKEFKDFAPLSSSSKHQRPTNKFLGTTGSQDVPRAIVDSVWQLKYKQEQLQVGMPNETSTLENSHSRSRISRVFENESSVWVRGSNEGVLEKTSEFEARMRATNLRILEDSRKLANELFWQNRDEGMYQILEVHQFI